MKAKGSTHKGLVSPGALKAIQEPTLGKDAALGSPDYIALLQAAIDKGLRDRTPVGIPAIDGAIPYLQGHVV